MAPKGDTAAGGKGKRKVAPKPDAEERKRRAAEVRADQVSHENALQRARRPIGFKSVARHTPRTVPDCTCSRLCSLCSLPFVPFTSCTQGEGSRNSNSRNTSFPALCENAGQSALQALASIMQKVCGEQTPVRLEEHLQELEF